MPAEHAGPSGPPPSARGNGLDAPAWVPVLDLDPRLAEVVLDALREADVAAYVAPSTGVVGAYLEVRLPDRPTDRLWVDARRRPQAEAVVSTHLPELKAALDDLSPRPSAADDDEAWAELIASFDSSPDDPVPPWPVSEDLDERPEEPAPVQRRLVREPEYDEGGHGAPSYDPAEEDHFVPPPPPPLPRAHWDTAWPWVALVGGILVLIVPTLFGYALGGWLSLLGVVGIVGGFVALVLRMGDSPPTDSGPDDGAVV